MIIIIGDFNAKIGNKEYLQPVTGRIKYMILVSKMAIC
jgi:hypothetical protein